MRVRRMAVPLTDRALSRLLRGVVVALVVGAPLFGILYALDQRGGPDASLGQRQVTAAEAQVRAAPDNVALRIQLGQAYRQADRLDEALRQFDEVLTVDDANRAALLGRGGVLLAKGDLVGAVAAYKKITSANAGGEFAGADPQLQEAHYYLAVIAARQGALSDAADEATAALRIDKTDADAWYLLGTVQVRSGATDRAVEAFRRALTFVPTGWCEPYAQLATAYRKLGKPAEAEYAAAMVDFCQHRPTEARTRLAALVSAPATVPGPTRVDAMLGLGMIAESTSDRDDAVEWYRRALAADPANATAAGGLARLGAARTTRPSPTTATKPRPGNRR